MIVWFNCKISDIRPNPQPRYHLRHDNRFDIARYSFASYAPLEPLTTKFIFNLEMADGHANQRDEMESWLLSIFPREKLELHWHRINYLPELKEFQKHIATLGDEYLFITGNEDQIFFDSNINMFTKGLEILKQDKNINAVMGTTHYPESIRASYVLGGSFNNDYVKFNFNCNDSMRIMHTKFFDWYLQSFKSDKELAFRTEEWNRYVLPTNIYYTSTKEQFRHFDGYSHVGIGPEYAPPIEIPPGFFNHQITIRYGFDDHDPDCVNLNPAAETLYAEDGKGADYRWVLDDLPAFWKPYIKNIIINPKINSNELQQARDKNILIMSRIPFVWPHFGITFDELNWPPANWVNNHLISLEFQD